MVHRYRDDSSLRDQLCEVQAVLLLSSEKLRKPTTRSVQEKFQSFVVVKHDGYHGLLSASTEVFARLDNVTSIALRTLEKSRSYGAKAVIDTKVLYQALSVGKSRGIFPLSVNIFGPEDEADNAGETLASRSTYLQHPCFLEDGIEYYNLQYFYLDNKKAYLTDLIGLSESDIRAKCLSDEVEGVLASLDDETFLNAHSHEGIPEGILTPLKQ